MECTVACMFISSVSQYLSMLSLVSIIYMYIVAQCDPECQNGGVCSQPNVCDCDGTGFTGQLCEEGKQIIQHLTIPFIVQGIW